MNTTEFAIELMERIQKEIEQYNASMTDLDHGICVGLNKAFYLIVKLQKEIKESKDHEN